MLLWDAEGANQWPWKHVCVTLFNLVLSRSSQYFGESKPDRGKKMAKGDYCAVFGCNNDRKFSEMYRFLREKTPHTISVLQESKPEVQGLDQKASLEEFQGEQTH